MGLAYIAQYARRETGATVRIIDQTWERRPDRQLQAMLEWRPDIVGIYCNTLALASVNALAAHCLEAGAEVVVGGPHPTIAPHDITSGLAVQGQGETVMASIIDGQPRSRPELDWLGHPALDLVDMDRYRRAWHYLDHLSPKLNGANIVASRGCAHGCTYCQPTLKAIFGHRVQYHSPEWVEQEARSLILRYKLDGLFFHDDTFTMNRDWLREVCLRLKGLKTLWGCNVRADTVDEEILRDMHDAGCRNIHLGIECASDRVRNDIYKKRISTEQIYHACLSAQLNGVAVMGFFMLGAPTETYEEMEETIDLACRLPLSEATFSITALLPGTYLHSGKELSQRQDYYGRDADPRMRRLQRLALGKFYWRHKDYVLKHLTSWQGLERLIRKVGRFV